MSLTISCSSINFKGPFEELAKESLVLESPFAAVFKIKVTAPKRYCVRPNNGILLPNKPRTISSKTWFLFKVLLQASDDILEGKIKDKFLIQYFEVDESSISELELMPDIWSGAQQFQKGSLKEFKLPVNFENTGIKPPQSPEKQPITPATTSVLREAGGGDGGKTDTFKSEQESRISFEKFEAQIVEKASERVDSGMRLRNVSSNITEVKKSEELSTKEEDEVEEEKKQKKTFSDKKNEIISPKKEKLYEKDGEKLVSSYNAGLLIEHSGNDNYSLAVVILVAIISFLIGALFF